MIDTLSTVRDDFTSNLEDRGTHFSFMWLDVNLHENWAKEIGIEQFPQVAIINPGKRKKYIVHSAELVTESSLSSLLNTIIGGNGRFKRVSGNKLPLLKNKE